MKTPPRDAQARALKKDQRRPDATKRGREQNACVQLLDSQVVQSNQKLLLGTLIPALAHDINNPNGCIRGAVDLMLLIMKDVWSVLDEHRRTQEDFALAGMSYDTIRSEFPQLLNDMRDSSERVTDSVRRMRDFSRQPPEPVLEEVDLNRAIAAAAQLLSGSLQNCTGRFEVVAGEDIPPLRGNSQHLVQAVVCLLDNACEAVSDRDQAIRIVTRHDADRRCIVLDVEDEGHGMSPEVLACAATPLFTTRQAQGKLGLGLSAATILISNFGGTLTLDSASGRGTRARASFPIPSPTPEPQ